jgi:hypothetical protein
MLEMILDQLHVKNTSNSTQEPNEVNGVVFRNGNSRLIGVMAMQVSRNVKNIHFLVDTGLR